MCATSASISRPVPPTIRKTGTCDGDPRAAFGIYDSAASTLVMRRVKYPVEMAQRRILDAGLPASLANRLGIGR